MRAVFILTILISVSLNCFAQKTGYKEIQIGKPISVIPENDYQLKAMDATDSNGKHKMYAIYSQNLKMCSEPIEYIAVELNNEYLIKQVKVVTKEFNVKDFQDYLDKLTEKRDCLISNMGKPAKVTLDGAVNENNAIGWSFKEENITFVLLEENMSTFAKNQKRRYAFVWAKNEKSELW